MKLQNMIFLAILSCGLLLGSATRSQAKMEITESHHQLSRIEQPLSIKIPVTLVGLGLIGAELWWFLGKRT